MFVQNNNKMSKAMQRLSSGLRINSAADDPAGLAISEKMRSQIRGLRVAARNAQDGISMLQTAEGALNETHSMLQKMRELAVQSANGTYSNVDRAALQDEFSQLTEEISRIARYTEFNTKSILDGSFNGRLHIGANKDQNYDISIGDMRSGALGLIKASEQTTNVAADKLTNGEKYNISMLEKSITLKDSNGDDISNIEYVMKDDDNKVVAVSADGKEYFKLDTAKEVSDIKTTAITSDVGVDEGYKFDEVIRFGEVTVVDSGDKVSVEDRALDISAPESANEAIEAITNAINRVSTQRGIIGARQNRLEHTINNLNTAAENLEAAESRIRDADMAKEMMKYTKYKILSQVAQAMMAQANKMPEMILDLLKSL